MRIQQRFVVVVAAAALVLPAAAEVLAQAQKAPLSPPGEATGKIGAGTVTIEYSRPSMRGRRIMGGLVPFGQVWRTGANRATHLKTDAALEIGGVAVPAGTYTLYTLPGETAWTLIVNKQTGQHGTQYDQSQDHARIDMRVESLASPVEQFTIAVADGQIIMEWETTRVSVPVKVK